MNENNIAIHAEPRQVKGAKRVVAQHPEIKDLDPNLLAEGKFEYLSLSTHIYTQSEVDQLIEFLTAAKESFLKTKKS